jgi:phosphomevalonate kinase
VAAYRAEHPLSTAHEKLCALAHRAARAFEARNEAEFVSAARAYGSELDALGRAADVPIVPPRFAELARLADGEGAAFVPSGAGGGDVAIWLSSAPPSLEFSSRARALSMRRLRLSFDREGVRPEFRDSVRESDHGENF